jgi:serine protease Do
LVNLRGEIVGINTAIVGQAYQGISFAIPSALAQEVYDRLRKSGSVERGWLGVDPVEVTEKLAEQFGVEAGAVVAYVVPDSPAASAGIEVGDVIVAWSTQPIREPSELVLLVAKSEIGSRAAVVVVRDRMKLTLDVTVGRRPSNLR